MKLFIRVPSAQDLAVTQFASRPRSETSSGVMHARFTVLLLSS